MTGTAVTIGDADMTLTFASINVMLDTVRLAEKKNSNEAYTSMCLHRSTQAYMLVTSLLMRFYSG